MASNADDAAIRRSAAHVLADRLIAGLVCAIAVASIALGLVIYTAYVDPDVFNGPADPTKISAAPLGFILPAAAAEPVPMQHGTQTSASVSEDGRTATLGWQSAPAARIPAGDDSGAWVDYTLIQTRHGDVEYRSSQLNVTVLANECGLRFESGGEIRHALLAAWPDDLDGPGAGAAWQVHERATAGECFLVIDPVKPATVTATWKGAGLAWHREYAFGNLSAPAVKWTHTVDVHESEAADRAYAFRDILAGHPPARNGTVQPVGASYDRAAALHPSRAVDVGALCPGLAR